MESNLFRILALQAKAGLGSTRFSEALEAIEGILVTTRDWHDIETLQQLRQKYSALLDTINQGADVPEFRSVQQEIGRQLVNILERNRYAVDQQGRAHVDMLDGSLSIEQRFECIWHSPIWTEADAEQLFTYTTLLAPTYEEKALIISAITLGALSYFDPCKVKALCLLSKDEDKRLRVRAQVGLVLTVMQQTVYMDFFPALEEEIKALVADSSIAPELRAVHRALMAALTTEETCKHLSEVYDQIPDLLAGAPVEEAPAKLQGMFRLYMSGQEMGSDLNYDGFKVMHHSCGKFFASAANWFWPFTTEHPLIKGTPLPEHLKTLFALKRHTHTDRYAFLGLLRNHEVKVEASTPDGEDASHMLSELHITPDPDAELKHYIFDVYRFFTLYEKAEDEQNPFKRPPHLKNYPEFKYLYTAEDDLAELIKTYMRCRFFENAVPLLEEFSVAHPQSTWGLRALAKCHYQLSHYDKAYDYYATAESFKTSEMRYQRRMISCLISAHREPEALPLLYKLHYKCPEDIEVWRQLGWCLLSTGDVVSALQYYERVCASKEANNDDYFNMGHAYLAVSYIAQAVEAYRKAFDWEEDASEIRKMFEESLPLLIKIGIQNSDLGIVLDLLK